MKCRKSKLLSCYIDQELAGKEKTDFEGHLRGCPYCREQLAAYSSMRHAFAQAERSKAPAWFSQKATARISDSLSRQSIFFPVLARFAQAVVVLFLIGAGVLAGGFLGNGKSGQQMGQVAASFSLDVFDPAPPDSVGGVYLAMTEVENAK